MKVEDIKIDEVKDSYFEKDKLVIEYKKKNIIQKILDSEITAIIIAFFGIVLAGYFIALILI